MSSQNHIVLFGGGLDSTVLSLWLNKYLANRDIVGETFTLLFVNYGQKAAPAEEIVARKYSRTLDAKLRIINLPMVWSNSHIMAHVDGVGETVGNNRLELRNPLLLMAAASLAASNYQHSTIYLGFHKEPDDAPFPDATTPWLHSAASLIYKALPEGRSIRIQTPFSGRTREEIARDGYSMDPNIFSDTWSCYEARGKNGWNAALQTYECGECIHCKTKLELMQKVMGVET